MKKNKTKTKSKPKNKTNRNTNKNKNSNKNTINIKIENPTRRTTTRKTQMPKQEAQQAQPIRNTIYMPNPSPVLSLEMYCFPPPA